jgi:hypothetical protein
MSECYMQENITWTSASKYKSSRNVGTGRLQRLKDTCSTWVSGVCAHKLNSKKNEEPSDMKSEQRMKIYEAYWKRGEYGGEPTGVVGTSVVMVLWMILHSGINVDDVEVRPWKNS